MKTKNKEKIVLFYDEECPFCKNYAKYLKLKDNFDLDIKDIRININSIKNNTNLNINNGFIVLHKSTYYQGTKALEFLNSAVKKNTIIGKLHFLFKYDNKFSRILYNILLFTRKIVLFILKKDSKI
ncbi:hypothetical protein ACN9J3_01235 [Aliarcobacter butzleri]|uniref:hypothetical protein n=1 Tax=Aliarcobacter butzleri TaxID=28197 RepID=UPI003B20E5B7